MANLRTTVIMKTDIAESTSRVAGQTQTEMGLQRKQHRQFIAEVAGKNSGSIFQEEGDGYWIEFPSVTTAVLAAIEMQQSLRYLQAGKDEKQRIALRAVITVGDILHQERDTIGTTMSLTARIEKITPPDEIYLSHAAWLILNKAEAQTSFVNEFNFKGFSEPEKIYKVNQKYGIRTLTDQYIVLADARGFGKFYQRKSMEEIENFLLEYDNLMSAVSDKYNGVIRQVEGDQYFLTFSKADQIISAIEMLCLEWKRIIERYKIGISIGIHKGNLNVFRSYVFGDDINITGYLADLGRSYKPEPNQISVCTSRKVLDEFQGTEWADRFQSVDISKINNEEFKTIAHKHGAFEFIVNGES